MVHRALGAVAGMMELYDDATGRWQATEPWWLPDNSPWWQSGNALQALLDFVYRATGGIDDEYYYDYVENAMNTIRIQREPLPWWVQGGGEFRASSTDDTGWWALALCRLYDLTGNTTYLEIAEIGAEYMRSYWDDVCGGGIWWDVDPLRYKTAISNTLLMKVQVSLHNRIPNDQMYLELALETWNWFNQSGMINEEYLINDRLNDITCENNRRYDVDVQPRSRIGCARGTLLGDRKHGIHFRGAVDCRRSRCQPRLVAQRHTHRTVRGRRDV